MPLALKLFFIIPLTLFVILLIFNPEHRGVGVEELKKEIQDGYIIS